MPKSPIQNLSLSRLAADWQDVDQWLAREARITLELATPHSCVDVLIRVGAGEAALYRYFPFIVQLAADAPQAEICEIGKPFDEVEILIERVRPADGRRVVIEFESELSTTPALAGIGPDERDLSVVLKAVAVRPASAPESNAPGKSRTLARRKTKSGAPVFIIGSGRAGSSVLTWALGQHPNIGCLEETNWLPLTLYGAASGFQMATEPAVSAPDKYTIDEDEFLQYIGGAVDRLHREAIQEQTTISFLEQLSHGSTPANQGFQLQRSQWSPKQRWVDGSPVNTLATLTIARAFPEAQFILTLRDPRQVVESYARFAAGGGPAYSAREAAINWLRSAELGLRAKEQLGETRVMVVFNEDMLTNPAALMRRIFCFLNEPNFDQSIETLKVKINTTRKSPEQENGHIDDAVLAHCEHLYRDIRDGVPVERIEWGEYAIGELAAWERHLRMQMITSFSGDIDPTADPSLRLRLPG